MGYLIAFLINLGRERDVATETVKHHDQCHSAVSLCTCWNRTTGRRLHEKTFKTKKERKKIRTEKESATESNPRSLLFRHTGLTRSSIARSVSTSSRLPSFLRSRFVCRLRPPPKLRPFPHFPLASTALSGVENNGFRLCCFAAVFVRSWEFNPCSIS